MLDGAGVRDTDDLVNMIPDMLMSGEDAGRANIWLRGIGSTKFDIGLRDQMLISLTKFICQEINLSLLDWLI